MTAVISIVVGHVLNSFRVVLLTWSVYMVRRSYSHSGVKTVLSLKMDLARPFVCSEAI
jgi:hypothetical protein